MNDLLPKELAAEFVIPIDESRLRAHAHAAAAGWKVEPRPSGPDPFLARVEALRQAFWSMNASLDAAPESSPLWQLRGNTRLLRSALWEDPEETTRLLPRVIKNTGEEPRIITVAGSALDATDSQCTPAALWIYVDEVQRKEPLQLEELWNLPTAVRFVLLERSLAEMREMVSGDLPESRAKTLPERLSLIGELGQRDWSPFIESLIALDAVLRRDPAGAYGAMDFESRDAYRKRIAFLARYSEATEIQVANHALGLAEEARNQPATAPRMDQRRMHVGFYIVGSGSAQLHSRIGFHPPLPERLRTRMRTHADEFYIGGIQLATILLIAFIVLPLVPDHSVLGGLFIAFLLLLLPAAQGAVDLMNSIVTASFPAQALPKLDFSEGIPEESTTLVAVPTLLLNEKQVRGLLDDMEIRFLANLDPHLHFALLTDLPDSTTQPIENDSDPLVDLAVHLVDELNRRYEARNAGTFLLLHRHRIFNARQGVWMGWERKRGKLLDLNKYLHGEYDSFPVKAGNLAALRKVRYVITLDSDTQLPRGSAQRLTGALAHPLNRAIIDPELRIVTSGYGILQPRIGVSVQSASRSRLAAIYSGETGFDIYTRAVSDAYQELYGEGIFTGKGIYEVSTLHAVLDHRFPKNALLSHDLIEGSYARAGLVSDVELIDDYPSHYSAYTRRMHRWVRGDWQIAQWLFGRVPDESGHFVRNPITTISRWKILDNLRRSMVHPFTLFLLVGGWLGLPGGPLYWTLATLFVLFVPSLLQLAFSTVRGALHPRKTAARDLFSGFFQSVGVAFLNLVFLPHQTFLSLDAIIRSQVRLLVTGQRLLEWETAAQAEAGERPATPVDRYLNATIPLSLGLALLIGFFNLHALMIASPILLLWLSERAITRWLNKPPTEEEGKPSAKDENFLRQQALLIWRYFREFGGEEHNYLIPDNVREEGVVAAPRMSPTNIGLLLNARQAACEMGYLTVPEFSELTGNTLATMAKLSRFRGHFCNWYNTQTLEVLAPAVVSTVDSGNLAASLYTLYSGAHDLLREPLLSRKLFLGIKDILQLLSLENALPTAPPSNAPIDDWLVWAAAVNVRNESASPAISAEWWHTEAGERVSAINGLIRTYLPWLCPEFAPLREVRDLAIDLEKIPPLNQTAVFAEELNGALQRSWATLDENSPNLLLGEQLRALLPEATRRLNLLIASLKEISTGACNMVEEMEFGFLLSPSRKLLSIGYDVADRRLQPACYDLLASEARIAFFIAIAKGEIPQQSWFRLGRTHTIAFDRPALLSWTGTMFEYLMPSLWMRSYTNTLMSRTLRAIVEVQMAFGRKYRIPWGISESGYSKQDPEGNYQYYAFGIPDLALKGTPEADPVVSPYSTFLALGICPSDALRNLHSMHDAGWTGAYGLYEAVDYSVGPGGPALVREWMAHHQGMSLLAILNLLRGNIVQQWFHANPPMQATELLLQEKPIRASAVKAAAQINRQQNSAVPLPKAG